MTNEAINIREAQPGDSEGIDSLYFKEYGSVRNPREWRWEFEEGPWGKAIVVVAEYKSKIVGIRTQIPVPMAYQSFEFLSGKNEHSIISEEQRGKRLFPLLCEKCANLAREANMLALWGFSYAVKAYMKAGFTTPGKVRHHLLVLQTGQAYQSFEGLFRKQNNRLAQITAWKLLFKATLAAGRIWAIFPRQKGRTDNQYKVESISKADSRIDGFWKQFRRQCDCYTIARTSEYLNWRIFSNPHIEYKMLLISKNETAAGYIILGIKQDGKFGTITDFCVLDNDDEAARTLMAEALQYFKTKSIAVVDAWSMGNNAQTRKYLKNLKKMGFITVPAGSPFELRLLGDKKLPADPENQDNWFVTEIFSEGIR